MLFIRPAELVPELATVPVYNIVIVAALIAALPALVNLLTPSSLAAQPPVVCVLLLLPAIVVSFPLDLIGWGLRTAAMDFLKVVLYFLLLLAVVNTERRLKQFLCFLAVTVAVSASLSLLHERGAIHLPALESIEQKQVDADGNVISYPRLRSTGIFNDPNDFAMILTIGIVASLYFLGERSWGVARIVWLLPIALCGYAFWLTRSRGGMLALFAAVTVLAHTRWGWRRALLAAAVFSPILALGLSGRGEAMGSGTGQQRVQFWSEGLLLMRDHPVFGIGHGNFVEEIRHVAHNSFVHSYTELGFVGGTLFFGANAAAAWTLYSIRRDPAMTESPEQKRLLSAVAAILLGAVVAQFSLSRAYTNTPYLAIGLATAFAAVVPLSRPYELPRFSLPFIWQLGVASAAFLVAIQVYVRFSVRWG
ncbi:MAG: O-antigen ligase family protein [Planctomycetaceae bacterium]|nr:O-antigen ligase family protein [Planctomycetaceae bacterium]